MSFVQKSIFPCIETLKSIDGVIQHGHWHQARLNKTQHEYFQTQRPLYLASMLKPPKEGLWRVRITYAKTVQRIEYLPYTPKEIASIGLVESSVEYRYKYADRAALNALIPKGLDEALIVCCEELKETTIANIALLIDGVWLTPQNPLLEGTTRQRLLASGFLKASSLSIASLKKAEKFAIMNALIGFKIMDRLSIKGL